MSFPDCYTLLKAQAKNMTKPCAIGMEQKNKFLIPQSLA